ncbi:MAG: hypothetical protein JSV03_10730, partial [Planctomycetota bacterium]
VPVYDPALVRLVQIYELPGNIQASNGRNRNPYLRPSIDFDNDGNMYCTGLWYSAKHPPCWTGGDWRGECVDDYRGDVVRFNTLGHRAGRNIYHVPVEDDPNTPEDESLNLIVERVAEEALGHVHYWAPTGMAVRKDRNELLVVCKNQCDCVFAHIFDLNNRIGSGPYPNELVLKEVLKGNVARADETCIDCDESNPPVDPECPYTFIFETPKQPYYAQNDDVSGRTFMANFFGDCGGVQNFMVLQNDPAYTVIGDVGYKIYVTDPNGQPPSPDTMNNNWDACSPALASDKQGACCDPSDGTCQNDVTQTACYNIGGIWQGKGTVCGQYPCPGQGACCTPCEGTCTHEYEDDCQSPKVWQGIGTACVGGICEICSPDQTMDADCDGDIDQDDFAVFQQCYTGAGNSYPSTPFQCKCFDYGEDNPGDGDIDSFDYDAFQSCATGPNVPAGGPCP